MHAVVAHGPGDLRIEDRPVPTPSPGNVLVRIVYGGICGSDLHYARDGRNGAYTIAEPLVLGHEVVGVLDRFGEGSTSPLPIGSRVAIHPATPTPHPGGIHGKGYNILHGGTYLGSASTTPHTHGGFAGFLEVTPEQLRPLPTQLPLARAVLAEPLAVAIHGISRLGDRVAGARVLVSGSGPIGLLAIAALRAAGASSIVAADLEALPLRIARGLGAESINLGSGQKPAAESFDTVVEAAGAPASLISALDAVRPGGAILQLGMLPAGPLPIPLAGLIAKEIALFGSQRFDVELDAAIELLATTPQIEAVISDRFPVERTIEAFARAADSAQSAKVVLQLGEDPDAGTIGS